MTLRRFASLCALSASAILAGCSPQPAASMPEPVSPNRMASEPGLTADHQSQSIQIDLSGNGSVSISVNSGGAISVAQSSIESSSFESEETEEQDIPAKGELVEDEDGVVYVSLGNGSYEEVELVETEQTVVRSTASSRQDCEPAKSRAKEAKAAASTSAPASKPDASAGSAPMAISSEADFQRRVLNASKPVLVVFEQSWCGACKSFMPAINRVAGASTDHLIARVDIAKLPQATRQWAKGMKGTPYTVAFHAGERLDMAPITGAVSASELARTGRLAVAKAGKATSESAPHAEPEATLSNAAETSGALESQEPAELTKPRRSGLSI